MGALDYSLLFEARLWKLLSEIKKLTSN